MTNEKWAQIVYDWNRKGSNSKEAKIIDIFQLEQHSNIRQKLKDAYPFLKGFLDFEAAPDKEAWFKEHKVWEEPKPQAEKKQNASGSKRRSLS